MSLSVSEIKKLLQTMQSEEDPQFQEWLNDPRKGVQQEIKKWYRLKEQKEKERLQYRKMTAYEQDLLNKGIASIAGVDEVGRGPLAGPVVAAAVILPTDAELTGINDSKKLSKAKRESFYKEIMEKADVGIGIIEASEIDAMNIYEATKEAMKLAISNLSQVPEHLLIDAMKLPLSIPQTAIIKGDSLSASIAAASIAAKVTRDKLMEQYAAQYPHYAFEKNMGYGTKEHLEGLETYGPCPIHRNSFSPVKEMRRAQQR